MLISYCVVLQVSAMNRGQVGGAAGGAGEDPVVRALTHILEKTALVNYKQVYAQLEGTLYMY